MLRADAGVEFINWGWEEMFEEWQVAGVEPEAYVVPDNADCRLDLSRQIFIGWIGKGHGKLVTSRDEKDFFEVLDFCKIVEFVNEKEMGNSVFRRDFVPSENLLLYLCEEERSVIYSRAGSPA